MASSLQEPRAASYRRNASVSGKNPPSGWAPPARVLGEEDLGEVGALSDPHCPSLVELDALKAGIGWNMAYLTSIRR
jgi:hypothetical protein